MNSENDGSEGWILSWRFREKCSIIIVWGGGK